MSLSVSTAEILVSDLPTKSVTLTPLRATVVREIQTTIQVNVASAISIMYANLYSPVRMKLPSLGSILRLTPIPSVSTAPVQQPSPTSKPTKFLAGRISRMSTPKSRTMS
jgi:hypothetical protein